MVVLNDQMIGEGVLLSGRVNVLHTNCPRYLQVGLLPGVYLGYGGGGQEPWRPVEDGAS